MQTKVTRDNGRLKVDIAGKCALWLYAPAYATDSDALVFVREDGRYIDLIEGGEYLAEGGRLILPLKPIRAYLLIKGEVKNRIDGVN